MEAEGAQEARRNGAVVHRRAQSGQGRRWGGRGLGLRRMERRCAGVVDAAGVAGGEMGEDCLDDLGRVDARDDAQRAATHEKKRPSIHRPPPSTGSATAPTA